MVFSKGFLMLDALDFSIISHGNYPSVFLLSRPSLPAAPHGMMFIVNTYLHCLNHFEDNNL